jgi:23S rRNA (uracil-5-)-methyltransferase RumA
MAEKLKKGNLYEMEVHDLSFGGKGICRWETEQGLFIIFIPNTIPGQLISARIVKLRKKHAEARLMKVLKPSDLEIETGYQEVSGAPFATLPMEKQRFYKQRDSLDQFSRIGHKEISEVFTGYIPSPKDWAYRNKMEYSFSAIIWSHEEEKAIDGFGLGFKRRGMWWCVDDLKKPSGLFDLAFESKLQAIKEYCEASGLTAWHAPKAHGFFRSMVVRYSFAEDKFLIALQTSTDVDGKFDMKDFAAFLNKLLPDRIAGVIHTVNDEEGDRFDYTQGASSLISGQDHLHEMLCGLRFKISLSSFFQTNPASAEELYKSVIELCQSLTNEGVIMDLFCGTGTIAQLMARAIKGPKIIGVDIEESSISDARRNAHLNGLDDLEFHAADVGKFLSEHPEYKGQISSIILDPPRAGIAPKSLNKVIELGARDIIYVSCNPSTQARDTTILKEAGYSLKHYHLVDQFPHTSHIEGVALFSKA